jgi:protein SCO1/2
MPTFKNFPIGTTIIGGLFLLVMLTTYLLVKPSPPPAELEGVMLHEFRQLQAFDLVSSKDDRFTNRNFQGKWSFVFFGYISCPDICPATLYVLDQVHSLLEEDTDIETDNIQFAFVSVDPQRDTLKKLDDYISYFNKKFIGATGKNPEIDAFSRQFGAGYVIEPETSPGQYNVIHTGAIFLVDPSGRPVASFSQPHYSRTIYSQFRKIRAYFSGS